MVVIAMVVMKKSRDRDKSVLHDIACRLDRAGIAFQKRWYAYTGDVDGYKFTIKYSSSKTPIIEIALYGNFPKQALWMVNYPTLDGGVVWRGNTLITTLSIYHLDEIIPILHRITLLAERLEHKKG